MWPRMVLILFSLSVLASDRYYPREFLEDFKTLQNSELKNSLFQVLSGWHQKVDGGNDLLVSSCSGNCYRHTAVGYNSARKYVMGKIYLQQDGQGYFVLDLYCQHQQRYGVGPMKIPNHNEMNVEHTWPSSKFNSKFNKSMQESDLHHLFPVNSRANSTRGNNRFAEVFNGDTVSSKCQISQLGAPITDLAYGSSKFFEPPSEHRGNVARAIFYFSVRYKMSVDPIEEYYLRKWHQDDPIDRDEIEHNDLIFELQGNRNPFIDFPELVDEIDNF